MELDDLKNDWQAISNQTGKPTFLTPKAIDQMTRKRYRSSINKIRYPELIGSMICLMALVYIGANFTKLDTVFLQVIGVVALALLLVVPVLSYTSLVRLNRVDDLNKPYIEVVKQFAIEKIRFANYQKVNALLNYLLLISVLFLLPKFFYDKDITANKLVWIVAFSFGYLFLLYVSKWVKRHYGNALTQAEILLKEIKP